MPAALPMALRARLQEYIREGLCGRDAAAQLKVSTATGVRWLRRMREQGDIAPDIQGLTDGVDAPPQTASQCAELRPCSRTLGYFTPVHERKIKWDNIEERIRTNFPDTVMMLS